MIRISILSPVRNEAKHIAEMIGSIQTQPHQDWEILFVDDGSTDDTVAIIKSHAATDPRIVLAGMEPAKGKVHAFNVAYSAASGEVIVLMAGDDRMPRGALASRVKPFLDQANRQGTLALFKLRTFSDNPRFDGITLPRGDNGSRSGGSMTMSADLAHQVFPIPEHLVAEDIWLGEATDALAARTVTSATVVLDYRIHDGNSNPRHLPFKAMSEATHKRHLAWRALLDSDRIGLRADRRVQLERLWVAEQLRYEGKVLRLLLQSKLPPLDRAAMLAKASPILYRARSRFYRVFSGLRGR